MSLPEQENSGYIRPQVGARLQKLARYVSQAHIIQSPEGGALFLLGVLAEKGIKTGAKA